MNLDVSELLFPKVYYYDFIHSLNSSLTTIIIPNWTCNDINYKTFDFSRFTLVESIEILKTIKIGKNSFAHNTYSYGRNESKSFHILNCESLESIQIGQHSFSYVGGEFELKNLPQLQSIQIGTIGSSSHNFFFSSFVIRGIELILNIVMIRSSKSTIHYIG